MATNQNSSQGGLFRDALAGLVVFLVALPLCLGVALASGAPLISGLLSGIVGGILVGRLSGSHTSVSGPAAGLTAVVAAQIVSLGSFPTFMMALTLAGLIQIAIGMFKAGSFAAFIPSSVIEGLLAAIGILLVLKQIPHVLGHDPDPDGEMSFFQPDQRNTFTEFLDVIDDFQPGSLIIGLLSIAVLLVWNRSSRLKKSSLPAQLVVVLLGIALAEMFRRIGGVWEIERTHMVQVPVSQSVGGFLELLQWPDFSQWLVPAVYLSALTIAAVASLETVLNLEAVDKLDPQRRVSPPNRELLAQGVGNLACGLIGGLPLTSVIVRSSVNIQAGGRSRWATIIHGLLLLVSVAILASWLNLIPLSCLGAILLVTGLKLASPRLMKRMWHEGRDRFLPFAATIVAIVFTDLLIGVSIGLAVSIGFILRSNIRGPVRQIVEKHLGGEVIRVELASQVSFLNRATFDRLFNELPAGSHVMLDASDTEYIDADILSLIRDFTENAAPARGVEVSLSGFEKRYQFKDQVQYVDYATRDLQRSITPAQVLELFRQGHARFRSGQRLTRDFGRQLNATSAGQFPLAAVLSCIDSRTPAELIFDLGVGDIFSVRVAGNVASREVLGSLEYACSVAGAKLVLVIGHTRCGAVTSAVKLLDDARPVAEATGCGHLDFIVEQIQQSAEKGLEADEVAKRNVRRVVEQLSAQSQTLQRLVVEGKIKIVGSMFDITSGEIEFLSDPPATPGAAL